MIFGETLEGWNSLLRQQTSVKDEQERETNLLVAGLQRMLSPLLSSGKQPTTEADSHTE